MIYADVTKAGVIERVFDTGCALPPPWDECPLLHGEPTAHHNVAPGCTRVVLARHPRDLAMAGPFTFAATGTDKETGLPLGEPSGDPAATKAMHLEALIQAATRKAALDIARTALDAARADLATVDERRVVEQTKIDAAASEIARLS